MLFVCDGDVIDVVFSVCIGRRGAVYVRVFCHADVYCVHPVAVLNAAFCMTCILLMLVDDARGDRMEEAYSRACLITVFYV